MLKDKIVVIDMEKTLIPLKDVVIENKRLEPMKIGKNSREIDEIYSKSASMLRDLDSNQDTMLQRHVSYH